MFKKRYYLFYFIMPPLIGILQVASFVSKYGWMSILLFWLLWVFTNTSFKKAALQGFLYGFSYFSFHSWGFLTFVTVNHFKWYYKGLPLLYFVLASCYSILWFIMLSFIKQKTAGWLRYFLYVSTTGFYIWWIHTKQFLLFGLPIGYPHLFPFLPIINNSALTLLFNKAGMIGASGIILTINAGVYFVWERKSSQKALTIHTLILLGLSSSAFFNFYKVTPCLEEDIIHCKPTYKDSNIYNMLQRMSDHIVNCNREDTKDILVAFPESSLPFYLADSQLKILTQNLPCFNNVIIALGAFFDTQKTIYNSGFLLHKSRIILHYDKKVLVPFWEFIPPTSFGLLNKLFGTFLKDLNPISSAPFDYCDFFYLNKHLYLPVVCSDLFWLDFSQYDPSISLLCLLNDSHFKDSLLQKIMFLYARFIAGTQRRKIAYIAYFEGHVIYPDGITIKKI